MKTEAFRQFIQFIKRQPKPFKVNMIRASSQTFLRYMTNQSQSVYILRLGATPFLFMVVFLPAMVLSYGNRLHLSRPAEKKKMWFYLTDHKINKINLATEDTENTETNREKTKSSHQLPGKWHQ